jgi:hypothetical protein
MQGQFYFTSQASVQQVVKTESCCHLLAIPQTAFEEVPPVDDVLVVCSVYKGVNDIWTQT